MNLLVVLTVEEAAVWHVRGESDDYSERGPSRYCAILGSRIDSSTGSQS